MQSGYMPETTCLFCLANKMENKGWGGGEGGMGMREELGGEEGVRGQCALMV